MKTHDLKTWPEFFGSLLSGEKQFELRDNDRGFAVGDLLRLREWDPDTKQYSGRTLTKRVSYILRHRPTSGCAATFGLRSDYVILSLAAAPDMLAALQGVVADILEYERINNLAPNHGRQSCWGSVSRAQLAIAKATAPSLFPSA